MFSYPTSIKTFFALSVLASAVVAGPVPAHDCEPTPSSTASLSRRQTHTGQATFFKQNGVAGACGQVHSDSDLIVALQTADYANGANCGKTIAITDTSTGKTVNGVVADECPTCQAADDIDLSVGLFTSFASEDVGVIPVSWKFA